jgi:hypothetical protein
LSEKFVNLSIFDDSDDFKDENLRPETLPLRLDHLHLGNHPIGEWKSVFRGNFEILFIFSFSQLLMGVFYYIHSVALVEDLNLEEHYPTPEKFYAAVDKAYSQVNNR